MKVIDQPIEVIALFKDGIPNPYKMRLVENDELIACKISRVIHKEKLRQLGKEYWKFDCEIIIHNSIKLCEIRFYLEKCLWMLYKI